MGKLQETTHEINISTQPASKYFHRALYGCFGWIWLAPVLIMLLLAQNFNIDYQFLGPPQKINLVLIKETFRITQTDNFDSTWIWLINCVTEYTFALDISLWQLEFLEIFWCWSVKLSTHFSSLDCETFWNPLRHNVSPIRLLDNDDDFPWAARGRVAKPFDLI